MYCIQNSDDKRAISGSSNFTVNGLGLGSRNNIELNLEVTDRRDRDDLCSWFEELWNSTLVSDVKDEVLQELSRLYSDNAPEFIYYKTLFHIFERFLESTGGLEEELQRSSLLESAVWKMLFSFQKDAAKGAINKIKNFNGCILADSVGLGKTFTALAVIKYFELKNDKVLVLCPKKLRKNWTVYRHNDRLNPLVADNFRFDVLHHTDLTRQSGMSGDIDLNTVHWQNYDLIVIDESHNFRNNTPGRIDENDKLIKSRYQRLMDSIKDGCNTKVLLLSATPVNNDLKDLRNQINLLTADEDNAFLQNLDIPSTGQTLRLAQQHFNKWAKLPQKDRTVPTLMRSLGSDFFKLLDAVTIARSRKHLLRYYKDEVQRMGGFPDREKPRSITTEIDLKGRFLSYDDLSIEIENYKLSLFNPSFYLKDEFKQQYEITHARNFKQSVREDYLIGMMKVNFLKRLESSVQSFEITMDRTINKIQSLRAKLKDFIELQKANPHLDFTDEAEFDPEDFEEEDIRELLQVGKKMPFKTAHLRLNDWIRALDKDEKQLDRLYKLAQQVQPEDDAKLERLKELIAEKAAQPTTTRDGQPNRKTLVFTAFADTATYLYENLEIFARQLGIHIALVTGTNGNQTTYRPAGLKASADYNTILVNFSPRSKERDKMPFMPQDGEINLLIATDCISEGQNLQDCDQVINYDIHWNPVKIIQRFGRIDRIGSRNKSVRLVNFWPTENLDNYISLKKRVESRMALVDLTATQEDNPLNPDVDDLLDAELQYRDRQLKKLREEILDLEDTDEHVTLTEFTLDDFRMDLLNYIQANREKLEQAPLGLYACVPPHPQIPATQPGVIFCLRRPADAAGDRPDSDRKLNPVSPYFLVYVHADGNVRFGFGHPKQILEIFRGLCAGKTQPYEQLCRLFDQETENGLEMSTYQQLLDSALHHTGMAYKNRVADELVSTKTFVIPPKQEQVTSNSAFELVTWLIIK